MARQRGIGSAIAGAAGDGTALASRSVAPLRALLVAALLSLMLGAALYEGLAGEHPSVAALRFRAASHLRAGASSRRKGLSSLPLAAQGPVSEALGADDPAYRVRASGGGLGAVSPAQQLSANFGRSGVSVSSGTTWLDLSLRAVGFGASLRTLGQVAPRVKANRVSYARAGLSEWYVNGPLGLEQGFTIPSAPSAHADGALTLAMALSGNAHASLASGGQSISFRRAGRSVLRYSGLSATDARGRALHSWLELRGGEILLRVDTAGARYPLRIDPFIQQGEKLTGGGERGEEGAFGVSVALSAGGEYALVGGPGDNGKVGAAWVFLRSGATWSQQGPKLTGKEEAGAGEFGTSVALSEKGEYALIGGPGDNEHAGAAWVFTRSGTTWTQQTKITGKEETGKGYFGLSVALAAKEANYALIGGPANNGGVGAAWVETRSGTTWSYQAKLTGSGESGNGGFGYSLALNYTGEYALLGGPTNNGGVGAAWVFLRESGKTTWAQQAMLTGSGETGEGEFGYSVALSEKGEYALIGAPNNNGNAGAAWVFLRESGKTTWAQQAMLTGSGETGEGEFGYSVALASKEANYALIGGPANNGGVGAAWVFLRETGKTTWTQQAKLTGGGESGNGGFGYSVALSATGEYALMGGPGDNREVGAAWVFTRSGATWAQQGEKLTGKEEIHEGESGGKGAFGFSVALSAGGEYALIGGPSDNGGVGAAWVFLRSGTTWTQQGPKLTGKEEAGAGHFGWSVALSEKGEYALIGGPLDNEYAGAAWVFTRSGTTWSQQGAKLTGSGESGKGYFGWSVALASKEANYALIGGPENNAGAGAAWVFLRSGEKWTYQATLTGKEESGPGEVGTSVALSSTGEYALLGGPSNKEGVGAAWVETRSGTTWSYQATLTGKEETGPGEFGKSVALSEKGEYALIGGPANNEGVGAAWVETRSGTVWSYQAKLAATEESGKGEFGFGVALASKEANYALIGGPANNEGVGAAWVLTRSGTTWTAQATLTGGGENGPGAFGDSVALSSTGEYALVGGKKDSLEVGAAWAFLRSGTTWAQQGEKLIGKEEAGEGEFRPGKGAFGFSVALSSEGNIALIGGQSYLNDVGAAWVFTRSGTTWTQQAKLTAKNGEEIGPGEFGSSVALSSSGSTALIGGYHDNEGAGAVWAFTRSGEKWTQQGEKLTGKEESGAGEFGVSVGLSATGEYALVGGNRDHEGAGAVWVFRSSGEKWTQQGEKLTGKEESGAGEFGTSVALSSEGNTALVGGPTDNTDVGAAWVLTRSGERWNQPGEKLTGKEESGKGEFGTSVALSANGNTALVGGPTDNTDVGAAWVLTRSGEKWTQQGEKLTGKEETGAGEFGTSVALSANGNTALVGGPADGKGAGAAWVLAHSGAKWEQQGAKLTAKSGEEIGEGNFGAGVALSSEGNTALVGGPDDNAGVGATWVFVNTSPAVETKPASPIAQTTATLNATVNPNGGKSNKCEFEYGETASYGKTASCASLPGSGTSPVAVSAAITGLAANTTYHFRISATNAGGTSKGSDQEVQDAAERPGGRSQTGDPDRADNGDAERHGQPQRRRTSNKCEFEYGTTNSYGKTASCASLPGPGRARSRCPRQSRASPPTRPTTSGSPRPTRAARAKAPTRNSRRCRTPRRSKPKPASPDRADDGDAERHGEPQRRRGQQMRIRIRHHELLRHQTASCALARRGPAKARWRCPRRSPA